jgi:hypothetical protein
MINSDTIGNRSRDLPVCTTACLTPGEQVVKYCEQFLSVNDRHITADETCLIQVQLDVHCILYFFRR